MMNFSKFKVFLLIAIVFLIGVVVGAAVDQAFLSGIGTQRHSQEPFIEKLQNRLHLSVEQTLAVQTILDKAHEQFKMLYESVKPQFEGIRQLMRTQISEQLDPDQDQEFTVMCNEYKQRKVERAKKYR